MPTFSRNLEQSLHRALALANERHHEYATLEHLLLALLDDQDAAAVMRACNVDLDKLRRSLTAYLESELENLVSDAHEDSKPTAGFQRVIQRAVIHVQSSGREDRDQHVGAGHLFAAGRLHVDDGALDHPLEPGGRLGILVRVAHQVFQFGFEIGDQAAAQFVEINIAGAHHRRGVLIVDQRQ